MKCHVLTAVARQDMSTPICKVILPTLNVEDISSVKVILC